MLYLHRRRGDQIIIEVGEMFNALKEANYPKCIYPWVENRVD